MRVRLNSGIARISVLGVSIGVVAITAPAQAPIGDRSAAAFASIADREVSQLHDAITLAQWMNMRGRRERWETKKPEVNMLYPRKECLSLAKADVLPSGERVKRALYFYPPPATPTVNFPAASRQQLLNTCILGMVWIEADAPTPETGHALDQAVRRKLTGRYGESIGHRAFPSFDWGGYYGDAGVWVHGAEVVSAYSSRSGGSNSPVQLIVGPVAVVHVRLPIAKLEFDASFANTDYRYRPIERDHFHRAISIAGVDAALSGRFEKFFEQVFPKGERRGAQDTAWQESFLPVLREWLAALSSVSPARRAAGLLAADLLLVEAEGSGNIPGWPILPGNPNQRSELQELGATFGLNGIAGVYYYARNWAKQARELDPNGPVGQMALIESLARYSCDSGSDSPPFRQVILDGEGLLNKGLDAQTAARVHFMVGDAYSTIVAIAGGLVGPNGEYGAEPAEGDADRSKALQHYRAGLAVDHTSQNAKDAWSQAWRISAGLLPEEWYVCFGD